jgi:hypothetical protein
MKKLYLISQEGFPERKIDEYYSVDLKDDFLSSQNISTNKDIVQDFVATKLRNKIDFRPIKVKIITSLYFNPNRSVNVVESLGTNIKIEFQIDVSSGKWQRKLKKKKKIFFFF